MIRHCPQCGKRNRIPVDHLADRGRCGSCRGPLPPQGRPLEVDEREFEEILKTSKVPVLVDFWAAWCGPCRAVAPHVEAVAAETAGRALVLKVDVERNPRLAQRYEIHGIPHFALFRGGKLVMSMAGAVDHQTMRGWIDSIQFAA